MEQVGGADSNGASAPVATKDTSANSSRKAVDAPGKTKSDKTEETKHSKNEDKSAVRPDTLVSQLLPQASMSICLTPSLSNDGKAGAVSPGDTVSPSTTADSADSPASAKLTIPQFVADAFPDGAKSQDKTAIEDPAATVGAAKDEAVPGTLKDAITGQEIKKVGTEEKQTPLPAKSNDTQLAPPTQDTTQVKSDAVTIPASDQKNSVGQHGQQIKMDENTAPSVSQGDNNSTQADAASAAAVAATIQVPISNTADGKAGQTKVEGSKALATNKIPAQNADTALAADLSVARKPAERVASKQESKQASDKDGEKGRQFTAPSTDIQPAVADTPTAHSVSSANQAIHLATPGDLTKQHAAQEATQTNLTRDTIQPRLQETAAAIATPEAGVMLHSAKLLERMGQSEVRLGIQAGEFGNIDIRTSMSHDRVTAEISVEHADLGRALAAELPSLQNKLAEHRISPASLVLQSQTDSSSSGHSAADWQRPRPTQNFGNIFTLENHVERWHSETNVSSAGLDVHI
jgi:hypothetical protein